MRILGQSFHRPLNVLRTDIEVRGKTNPTLARSSYDPAILQLMHHLPAIHARFVNSDDPRGVFGCPVAQQLISFAGSALGQLVGESPDSRSDALDAHFQQEFDRRT